MAGDADTRERLLEAAKALFAERGYDDVTVRDICRAAAANVSLVNYYYGGKLKLYLEVADAALAEMRAFNRTTMDAPEGSTATQKLEHFVRVFIRRVLEPPVDGTWVHQLMRHEMERPTAAARRLGAEGIAPRMRYLMGVVAELLDREEDDPVVLSCVGSVHGLCLIYTRALEGSGALMRAVPELARYRPLDVDRAARHVIDFSLAGIAAMRKP